MKITEVEAIILRQPVVDGAIAGGEGKRNPARLEHVGKRVAGA